MDGVPPFATFFVFAVRGPYGTKGRRQRPTGTFVKNLKRKMNFDYFNSLVELLNDWNNYSPDIWYRYRRTFLFYLRKRNWFSGVSSGLDNAVENLRFDASTVVCHRRPDNCVGVRNAFEFGVDENRAKTLGNR